MTFVSRWRPRLFVFVLTAPRELRQDFSFEDYITAKKYQRHDNSVSVNVVPENNTIHKFIKYSRQHAASLSSQGRIKNLRDPKPKEFVGPLTHTVQITINQAIIK